MSGGPRVGFAGVGWIGRHRLEAVAAQGRVTIAAVADPLEANRNAARPFAPQATFVDDFEELLGLELDAVVIATPSAQHAQQAVTALGRGLAVFCQKPVGRNSGEAAAVVAAAERADRLLGADLSYRHTTAFSAVRALAISGALGNIYAARFVFHNAYGPDKPWFYDRRLSGGGCLIDLGTHLVDQLLWLLPAARIVDLDCDAFSKGARLEDSASVEDFVSARLAMDSGTSVELACSWGVHAGKEAAIEVDVYGTTGGASVRNLEGSFYDFAAYRHQGTKTQTLCVPPDAWGGRAIADWALRLARGQRFDPECRGLISVSAVLDALYARCRP
jgi:predicted dehydrogenase